MTPDIAPKFVPLSRFQASQLHILGMALYGNKSEWDAKRPELIATISKGRVLNTNNLSTFEAASFIAALERKIRQEYHSLAEPLAQYPNLVEEVGNLQGRDLAEAICRVRARLTMATFPDLSSLDEIAA